MRLKERVKCEEESNRVMADMKNGRVGERHEFELKEGGEEREKELLVRRRSKGSERERQTERKRQQ